MKNTTHNTAVVVIPPEDIWGPIQAIRQQHDSKAKRWMPHITLIYPFGSESDFGCAAEELAPVCKAIRPFDVELAKFWMVNHGKGYCTIWLAPEPERPLRDLHAAVWTAVSWQDAFEPGIERFEPHLSVGRSRGMVNAVNLLEELQANWAPIRFPVQAVHLISRGSGPDDAFQIVKSLPLQGVRMLPDYTPRQGEYLAFIYYYTKLNGQPPAEHDMARYFGVSAPSVHQMVVTLEKRCLIRRTPGQARSIKLLLEREQLPDLE